MARQLRIEYAGAFYHITSRGNERKDIFKSEQDFKKFLTYLETATQRYGAVIHVYCLMSNHYHLLLETPMGNLSQIMRHINGAYTTYFNTRRQRAGHLFQGRYKAILVDADEYAGELSRYIHLNPVRAGIVSKPEQYLWSSYQYYVGKKIPKWLIADFILNYFGGKTTIAQKRYSEFVNALVDKEYDSPLKDTVASTILGGIDFINEIKDKYLSGKETDRNLPALTELTKASIKEIIGEVEGIFKGDEALSKKASIYLCHKYSGRTLKEIGDHFNIGESSVSQTSRRFNIVLDKDKKLRRKMKYICSRLMLCNV
ncbi:MAG: transposase [Thermodesulfovibrionia bacterium]|nr:transposase [Thermodesulfovibrionia bacterium]